MNHHCIITLAFRLHRPFSHLLFILTAQHSLTLMERIVRTRCAKSKLRGLLYTFCGKDPLGHWSVGGSQDLVGRWRAPDTSLWARRTQRDFLYLLFLPSSRRLFLAGHHTNFPLLVTPLSFESRYSLKEWLSKSDLLTDSHYRTHTPYSYEYASKCK